jgi:CxxC motif-containing protein (DUF1111 family)
MGLKTAAAAWAARSAIAGLSLVGGSAASAAATDPGIRPGVPSAGDPVPGLTADQMTLFSLGQVNFKEVEQLGDGLGPRFNLDSCVGCHIYPTHGGSSPPTNNPQATVAVAFGAKNTLPTFITPNGPIREARFQFTPSGARDGGVHSLFVISGRVDGQGSAANCTAVQEDFNTQFARGNVSLRIPTPTYGLGLVENIPDTTLTANLAVNAQQKSQLGISGHFNTNPNDGRIARFGWKAQNVSLLLFASEAYNVEMGITNENFPTERDLNPTCQTAAVPNSIIGQSAITDPNTVLSDIEKFGVYMRYLGPPIASTTVPGGADSITRGSQVFNSIGCAMCHTPSLKSGNTTVAALGNQNVPLFSDLAVHHMGTQLMDNVIQGSAGPDEFRTAPLWGLGQRAFFLHDGRTNDLVTAIQDHAGGGSASVGSRSAARSGNGWGDWNWIPPSEANRVIANYNGLSSASQQDLLNFLRSL